VAAETYHVLLQGREMEMLTVTIYTRLNILIHKLDNLAKEDCRVLRKVDPVSRPRVDIRFQFLGHMESFILYSILVPLGAMPSACKHIPFTRRH
jgi:hypothetical protein